MTWYMIRLDLARTRDFPQGSREHCYLLCAPLDVHGIIDGTALAVRPERATVLRSSPDAPEMTGYLVYKRKGWAFSYAPGDADDEPLFHLETHPLREGEYVTVTERDGNPLAFEVSSREALDEPEVPQA